MSKGASVPDQALVASDQAASRLAPSGFDPSRGLSHDMLDLLMECPRDRSFVAAELNWSRPGPTGNALARLAERGLLISASDPEKWGRSRYILSPHGDAIAMEARSGETEGLDPKDDSAGPEAIAHGGSNGQ